MRGEQPETRETRKDRARKGESRKGSAERSDLREGPAEKADVLAGLAEISDGALRETVFHKAAMLGVDLLSGEESLT
jgi:hypothetical protein